MKKALLILFALLTLTANAWATTVTVSAYQLQNLPFNPTNIGSTRTFTVTVTSGSATVTSSAAFPSNIVGVGGFQILIGSTQYVVSGVASTSSLTLTTNYSGSTGSATMTLYPYVLLRAYATAGFQDNVTGQNIQPGTPGSGNFYKQVAVSIINSGSGNVAYMPEFTLPSTTDALINNQARYVFQFVRTDGSLLAYYMCGSVQQLALQPNTPTTWTAICNYNAPGGIVPPNTETYTKAQIDQRFASCSQGQSYYFAANGNIVSCLNFGSGLTLVGNTLTATGGGGGGSPGGAVGSIQYNNSGSFGGYTLGQQLAVNGTTLQGSGLRGAINAVVDYGVMCDGTTNTLVSLQNAVDAAAAAGGKVVYLPAGTCRINGTLTIPGGVTFEGDGMQRTTISSVSNAVIVDAVEGSGSYAFLGPTIRNIKIQGSKTAGSNQVGLRVDDNLYYAQGVFENIQIYQAGSHGLSVGKAFSSRFVNIYSDDNAGFPFYINSPNMPANHYESLYAQATNSGGNAGFRILAGDFLCISCNGINVSAAGSWNAIIGQAVASGDDSNVSAFAQWINSNFESAKAGGIDHRYNSVSTFSGHNQFAGDAASSGSYIAIRYSVDAALFPPYFAKGRIDDSTVFASSPASFYTNSQPIHSNDLPPLTIDGQGPKVAGGNAVSTYRNTTSSNAQQLYRSDAYYPTVTVTTSTSFTNPGARYFEVTCGSNCTLTLPWPGWYSPGGEPIIVKNLSTSGVVVTLAANSGGSVNTPNGYTLAEQYQSVSLIPDATATDYRVVGKVYPGVATRIPVYSDTNNATTISGLGWDAGSAVLTSPGRFWGADTSAGAPTFSFSSDIDTGFYKSSDGKIGFASNGSEKLRLQTNGMLMLGNRLTWDASETIYDLTGSGTPEGSITASVGSVYRRTNGSTGTTLYVKESGSGNTGWAAVGGGGVTSLTGTANQITASASMGAVTLSLAGPHNFTTATSNGVAYGNGTGALQFTAAGGVGTLCLTSTNGAAPVFGACSGSAATALSSITAAVAANTIGSGDNAQVWQWSISTASKIGFAISESAASSGSGAYLHTIGTLATSTAKPIRITAGGTADGVEMSTAGSLGAIGAGGIVATTGDSATAFFSAGQIEAARGGTGSDSSASTGIPRVTAGTWTYNAGIAQLATSTSADLRGVLSDETGSGVAVFATSPTLVTPVLGAATATSINGLTITSSTGTLTIANGKTATISNTLTLAGTDGTTMTFPGTSGAVATADSTTTFTNKTYNTAGTGNAFSINSQSITSVSGNTSKVGTTGTPSSGKCLEWDANGNIVTAVSNAACGSGGGSSPPFSDATALVMNSVDNTKRILFSAASISTGVTRTYTGPDASGILVLEDNTATLTNKFIDNANNNIILPFSDLADPNASITFSGSTFNTTWNYITGLQSYAWSGNTAANNAFSLAHSNTTATGTLLNLSTSASVSVKPLTISPRAAQAFQVDHLGNTIIGSAALSTSATNGFLYLVSSAGPPTGVPTTYTGRVPLEVDTTNSRLYGYFGGAWVNLSPAAAGASITVGTTVISSGTSGRVPYNNGGVYGETSGFTSDGTNVTAGTGNLRATSPRITTQISDANGNPSLRLTPTASATQSLLLVNAVATGTVALSTDAPVATTTTRAGTSLSFTASNATAGTTTAGAAAGGGMTFTTGNAAQLTSGTARGGDFEFVNGTSVGTASTTALGQIIIPCIGRYDNPSVTWRLSGGTLARNLGFGQNCGGSWFSIASPNIALGADNSSGGMVGLTSSTYLGWGPSTATPIDCPNCQDTALKRSTAYVIGVYSSNTSDNAFGKGATFSYINNSPSQITADQNNYNPGQPSYFQRWSSDASRNVTGLTFTNTQQDGQTHLICNVGSNNIVLANESASSTAANRFTNVTGANITIAANQCVQAIYDNTSTRWRAWLLN